MKPIIGCANINRRVLLAVLAAFPATWGSLASKTAPAQTIEPLPSWNDGPTKQAILDFVRATTDQASRKFVPPEDRIATFDQDGTLWVEHQLYTQVVYCPERVQALVAQKTELRNREPFKTVLSGYREAIAKLSLHDLEEILVATLTGMSVSDFDTEAKKCSRLPNIRAGSGLTPISSISRCSKSCDTCATMDTRPT
jgi:hypothetical protein